MQVETTIAGDTSPFLQPGRHPGFSSFKTIRPILYPARWHRDLLIQATLDPAIEAIGQASLAEAGRDELNLDMILGGTRVLVAATRDGDGRLLQERRPGAIVLAKSTVLAEPRASDARAVWATRGLAVQPGDRLRILIASEDGGTHPIRELAACVRHPDVDPFETVLSLVCRGDLLIDMKDGLQPRLCENADLSGFGRTSGVAPQFELARLRPGSPPSADRPRRSGSSASCCRPEPAGSSLF